MAQPILDLTEEQSLEALRSFLLAILPEGTPIVHGQDNRVPEPQSGDFVVMTPIVAARIETNTETYSDGYPSAPGVIHFRNPAQVTVQLDIHGPNSGDNMQMVVTLFRSEWGCRQFQASGFDVTPLTTDEPPHQIPFLNGEGMIEIRWVVSCLMQCNPIITVGQDFMSQADVNVVSVDVVYPPH